MSLASSRWASPSKRTSRYPSSTSTRTSTLHTVLLPNPAPSSSASRASNTPTNNNTSTTTTTTTTSSSSTPTNAHRLHDLALCTRLIRRLRWKAELLLVSHRFVVSSCSNPTTPQDDIGKEATIMFKLDFFEFFVLLERCIALLLACLRIAVPRTTVLPTSSFAVATPAVATAASTSEDTTSEKPIFATRGRTPHPLASFPSASTSTSTPLITSTSTQQSSYTHRYHANLLSTLDQPSNPIHPILGLDPVRRYLGLAKECRNKWKTAGEPDTQYNKSEKEDGEAQEYTVESLELERMLPCVLEALDRARNVTEGVVREAPKGVEGQEGADVYMGMDVDVEFRDDGAWEAVPDAMEWE